LLTGAKGRGLQPRFGNLYTVQSTAHLADIINNQLSETMVSVQHRGVFELLYLYIGLQDDFLSLKNFAILPDVPNTIARSVWEFVSKNEID